MNTPLITWGFIVGLFIIILLCRLYNAFRFCASGKHRVFDFGSEREELFLPGDPNPTTSENNDYEDFEDL